MSHYRTIQALGSPNVIHQGVIDLLGDFELAGMLSHFMYWSDKTDNPLGVYRSNDEFYALFRWSPAKVKRISDKLQEMGLINKTEKRLEHRNYYLFNSAKFDELYGEYLSRLANQQNSDSPIAKTITPQSPKQRFGDNQNGDSLYTKITTKITSESESENPHALEKPNLEIPPQEKIQNQSEFENPTPQETFEFLKSSLAFGSEFGIISEREMNLAEITALTAEVTAYWSTKNLTKQQILAKILGSVSRLGATERIERYTLPQVNANAQPTAEAPVTASTGFNEPIPTQNDPKVLAMIAQARAKRQGVA